MASKTSRPMSFIKGIILIVIVFQLYDIFSPPVISNASIAAAPTVSVNELVANIDLLVDQALIVEHAKVTRPTFLYFGAFYYLSSLDKNSRILVLTRKYPPKEGTIISVAGMVKPIVSINSHSFAYFKQKRIQAETFP